jgi:cytochrome b6
LNDPELNNSGRRRYLKYYFGGISVLFLLLQVITGALLSIYYQPSAEDSYASIQYIINQIEFGSFIRSIHFWAAHALILSAAAFVMSSFLSKSYRKPKQKLWYILLLSILLLLAFAFTGQTLPWTEFSYFGAVIGISQVDKIPAAGHFISEILKGGPYFGGETLSRMFSIHTIILPASLFLLLVACICFIRSNNSLNVESETQPTNLQDIHSVKIVISALAALALITTISVLIPKGLGKLYDISAPTGAPEGIHPEWYFMWIYQTLKADNFLPGVIVQLFLFVFVIFWFSVPLWENKFSTGRNKSVINAVGIISVVYIFIMTIWGYADSGISPLEISSPWNIATGGIGRFSFLGIILFTIFVMITLLLLRLKSTNISKD